MIPLEPIAVVRQFIDAINGGDVESIGVLMTEDHRFTDAAGNVYGGRENMVQGWGQYLSTFPDYHIEIEDIRGSGAAVAVFGYASGSANGKPWRISSAFRALVRNAQVAEWRVYADIEPMLRSMGVVREFDFLKV
jgi:ketosteroid isomerase-like protein